MGARAETAKTTGAYCPHCHLIVDSKAGAPWPPRGIRCPHCQLLIGAGRARSEPSGRPGARGTAAGVFSRQAIRDGEDHQDGHSPERVLEAIRAVADSVGQPPERLLMVDYQQRAVADAEIPPLSDVFSSFGSWKSARRQAAGS